MVKVKPPTSPKITKKKSSLGKTENIKSKTIMKPPGRQRRRRGIQKKTKRDPTGVVYLSHIPHGFYEEQIEGYFSQFGKVTGVNVPRSKSGRAKGYAFIEYKYPEIAQIAADTMNNYLMMNRLMKAKYIPPDKQKPKLFHLAKLARQNNETLAKKAELAIKHNRKVKNRYLKMSLTVNKINGLLKRKELLAKRMQDSGLNANFEVEEANYESVLQQKKELDAVKKNNIKEQESMSESEEATDSDEHSPGSSLESDDSSLGDSDKDDSLSESDDEDRRTSIFKARRASRDILKKKMKSKTVNTHLKVNSLRKSLVVDAIKSFTNSPQKSLVVDDIKSSNSFTPTKLRPRKSLNKNITSSVERTQLSGKKRKAVLQTPSEKKLNVSLTAMAVNNSQEDKNCNTPSGTIKKLIKAGKNSAKSTPKEKAASQGLPTKQNSSKKTPKKEVKLLKEVSPATPKSPSGKKLRHRQLKNILSS
ncbi:RNA-binding protein 28-like [Macrosteles quadrilineatus]|uniref:RNA-binding protein 28-like n=1 Tax=Macrosteles quadrilineatus TaxID=74068 RepID=UPI0023E129C7|nr:RNA-binding protein 28-like [Macrosteles quadrilineatus]